MRKAAWVCLLLAGPLAADYLPFDDPAAGKTTAVAEATEPEGTLATVAGWAFRVFQVFISSQDGPNCRYWPTCSHYALIAFRRYGPLEGFLMAGDRFLRCNPFGGYGYDPPEDHRVGRREGR